MRRQPQHAATGPSLGFQIVTEPYDMAAKGNLTFYFYFLDSSF